MGLRQPETARGSRRSDAAPASCCFVDHVHARERHGLVGRDHIARGNRNRPDERPARPRAEWMRHGRSPFRYTVRTSASLRTGSFTLTTHSRRRVHRLGRQLPVSQRKEAVAIDIERRALLITPCGVIRLDELTNGRLTIPRTRGPRRQTAWMTLPRAQAAGTTPGISSIINPAA